MTTAWH